MSKSNKSQVLTTGLKKLSSAIALGMMVSSAANAAVAPLTVKGNQIEAGGEQKSFAGMSLFWSSEGWGGEKFYTADTVKTIKNDWGATLIRAAMGADEEDGGSYFHSPQENEAKVELIVDTAIAEDMYVIIDWHSHYAHKETTGLAIDFFDRMSKKYGENANVIYEIFNEPKDTASWPEVKEFAEGVIAAIRKNDPDNLIIVGSPNWSQDVDTASLDPIDDVNTAYTIHFYADTHGQWLRDKAQKALDNGVALFATEWGSTHASGDGDINYEETIAWMDFLKENNISHAKWSINDKDETASAIVPGGDLSTLTLSGELIKDVISNWDSYTPGDSSKLDLDGDTVLGGYDGSGDNCPGAKNEDQADLDKDSIGDLCDDDIDGDGWINELEEVAGTDPYDADDSPEGKDDDEDDVVDAIDNCINDANTDQSDIDKDGLGDVCDIDIDGDGWSNADEAADETDELDPTSHAPASTPLAKEQLMDDLADNDITTQWGGLWETYHDNGDGGASTITPDESLVSEGAVSAVFALDKAELPWGPNVGVQMGLVKDGSAPNLTGCTRIQYDYKGSAHNFRVNQTSVTDYAFNEMSVSESDEWTTQIVLASDLEQPSWTATKVPFSLKDIAAYSWQINGSTGDEGTLMLDNIACVGVNEAVENTETETETETEVEVEIEPVTETEDFIDNLDDGDLTAFWQGQWNSYHDNADGGLSVITENDSLNKMGHIHAEYSLDEGTLLWGASVGVELKLNASETVQDLSGCTAVQYDYKGAGHNFRVNQTTVTDWAFHEHATGFSDEWTTLVVPVADIQQPSWSSDPVDLDLTSIKSFSWQVGGSTGDEGTLMVDNVACIGATAPSDANFEGSTGDSDGDGINDGVDNCPEIANSGQWDRDNDGLGNECDSDIDGDGFSNAVEIAAGTRPWDPLSFPDTDDADNDGVADSVDNCPEIANSGQWDRDNDGLGNACDDDIDGDGFTNEEEKIAHTKVWNKDSFPTKDSDNDTVDDSADNCIDIPNVGQWDRDKDGIGNECDFDIDGDGFSNVVERSAGSKIWNADSTPENP